MRLFDLAPKESAQTLFGRDEELRELTRLLAARRWVAILGARMVGKTSLAKVALKRLKLRGAYVNLWGVQSLQGMLEALLRGINESGGLLAKIRDSARRVRGLTVGPVGLSMEPRERPLDALRELLNIVGSETKDCLIVLDEIQELAPQSGRLLSLLGQLFNTYPHLTFVFTGSVFGLTRTLLEPSSASPLFGRSPVPVRLAPFDAARSLAFLQRGTREFGIRIPEAELMKAIAGPLDGTPGWLTLFGNHLTVRRLPPGKALAETVREGKRVAKDEVEHFLHGREPSLYWSALKAVAVGAGWSAVHDQMSRSEGRPVNNGTVGRVLNAMASAYLVSNESGLYRIMDPMVRTYVLESRGPPR